MLRGVGQPDLPQKAGKRKRKNRSVDGGSIHDDGSLGAIFNRVATRRQKEVAKLGPALVRVLLIEIREFTGNGLPSLTAATLNTTVDTKAASKDVRGLIENEYRIISDESALPNKRRRSWNAVSKIFRLIDGLTGAGAGDEDEPETNKTHVATNGKDSIHVEGKKSKSTSKIINDGSNNNTDGNTKNKSNSNSNQPTSENGNKSAAAIIDASFAASPRPSSSPSSTTSSTATATATVTATAPPNPTVAPTTSPAATRSPTEKTGGKSTEQPSNTQKTTANNNNNNRTTRTVASLSSASASTMATALSSNTSQKINHKKSPPVHPSMLRGKSAPAALSPGAASVPIGKPPPPYEKRSAATQLHKAQRQFEQQKQKHPEANIHPAMMELYKRTQSVANGASTIPGKNGLAMSSNNKRDRSVSAGVSVARASNNRTPPPTITATTIPGKNGVATSNNNNNNISTTAALPLIVQPSAAVRDASTSFASSSSRSSPKLASTALQGKILNVSSSSASTTASKTSSIVPDIPERPIPTRRISTMDLLPDDSDQKPTVYSCSVHNRPRVSLDFQQHTPTEKMTQQFLDRLNRWDPYWKIEKSLHVGLTAPVTFKRWADTEENQFFPNTAAAFRIKDLLKTVGPRIRTIVTGQAPMDKEMRVLIRMLPLDLSKQEYGGKNRADVHIWPKGTYLQIHAAPSARTSPQPLVLTQRKQQSHKYSKWLGVCKHADVTSLLHSVWSSTTTSLKASSSSTVELGCYDPEIYLFSLALCSYRTPTTLSNMLCKSLAVNTLTPVLKKASLEEMYARAKRKMETNEVMLIDDSDNDESQQKSNTPKELRRIPFSIQDPLTMAKLKIPVRGVDCSHIACFDLLSFLVINKSAGGQRWKCGRCENFTSHQDLEYCALTAKAVKLFGDKITNLQHNVEFREDKSMVLCKPVRSHQERAKAKKAAAAAAAGARNSNGNPKMEGVNDVVELLDSDSE